MHTHAMPPSTQQKSRPLGAMFNSLKNITCCTCFLPLTIEVDLIYCMHSLFLPPHSYFLLLRASDFIILTPKLICCFPSVYCLVSFDPSFIMSIVLSPLVLSHYAILCMQFTSTLFLCCRRFDDVIGNGDIAKKLVDWLKRWDAVHLKKTVKVRFHHIHLV